ncbi:hypothetical protein D6C86_08925 [Aureobasidium pullulans]|uniref:DBF4-type domain-containing protein n=1 Tax=Aureobasidium pullulans TaxID=5580 RepID=A0A4S9VRQ6_AURPU|nr:hypothetical protein D6D26_07362 [Aureobasidium pullulans]THW11803.1 hypothetical protein D6D23_10345 [Aureobasidium pullulans]THW42739.1 hypothetical protein D6D21_05718 [Aureobasidium pullulans]THW57716.1 hypothetical protein D6D20_07771 [Aureobasidium pullulans]THW83363.1 hypothetical protein D6D18_08145 [Aureobasidium pullulans]
MSSKRLPLANNSNAVNSPFRTVNPISGKRSRAQDPRDAGQPPLKKQVLDLDHDENQQPRSLIRQSLAQQEKDAQLFLKKPGNAPPTAFERKLAAARKPPSAQKPIQRTADSLESIRQWQRHYRKAFPQFVFYFESVSDDVRTKVSRQIQYLGAKEEKFFSRSVTHVVTTRPIPPELASTSFEDGHSTSKNDSHHTSLKTIDPSLLDRPQDSTLTGAQKKTADLLEASLQGRTQASAAQSLQTVEPRKLGVQSNDVLSKARELGIKIWALEKLQRMMTTMFDTDTGEQPNQRRHIVSTLRRGEKADLQTLLRNEKVIGPADRDLAVAAQDSVQFRGNYIYVHDMDERTRPVMVRDYPKVTHKEEGKWPQFRLTPIGRCPFVEDPSHTKKLRLAEEQKAADAEKERKLAAGIPVTRSRAAAGTGPSQSTTSQPKEPVERQDKPEVVDDHVKPLDPPKNIPNKRQNSMDTGSMPALFGSTQANMRGAPRFIGGEPVASGVQPSNITSAIRSQIVSSTISSTAPGTRNIGASKEITALKRRALERGASVNSNEPLQSSYLTDMRAAINGDRQQAPRAAKRKAQETLGHIREEGEEDTSRSRRTQQVRKKVVVEREMKAGYCENCRDKFDDFDAHCQSRKHRKFAMAPENWSQLDDLLNQLERPLKKV